MDATNLAELYALPPLDWAPIPARLDQGVTQALATTEPGGATLWNFSEEHGARGEAG
ncbi:MAG: hypothetical protein ACR2HV_03400 [Acidimicrobiales bacterium]